jgi:hypothetical protein
MQRISLFFFLAAGCLLLVYALAFITDVYLFYAYGDRALAGFYQSMQQINARLLWKAVLIIVFAAVLFLLELGKHAAGLFTLIIVMIIVALSVYGAAGSLTQLAAARQQYSALDFGSLNRYIERGTIKYSFSTLTYDLGLAGHGFFLCSSLFMAAVVIRNAFVVRETETGKKERS